MFDICIYGNPVLRRTARPVTEFGADLKRFVREMTETMIAEDGVGLAAPQVNRSIRVVVIDTTAGEEPPVVLINPAITWSSDEQEEYEEGCLSIPDIRLSVKRPVRVSVRAQDIDGNEFAVDETDGLLARALQHEIDHLDGVMFVDRVSPLQRQLVAAKLKKLAKVSRDTSCSA
jgi:peptide deformylase